MQDVNDNIGIYKNEIATKEEWEALEKCMKEVLGDEYKGEGYEEYLKRVKNG